MDKTHQSQTQDQDRSEPIIEVSTQHHKLGGRVSALACSPNLVYVGTVAGDIRVIGRINGEDVDKKWDHEHRCIEGVMFDFEGKMVYATEMNLVLVNRNFDRILKEYRSHDPLRKKMIKAQL